MLGVTVLGSTCLRPMEEVGRPGYVRRTIMLTSIYYYRSKVQWRRL